MNMVTEKMTLLAPTVSTVSGFTRSVDLSRFREVTLFADVTAITGSGATVVVSHQYSHDNSEWYSTPVAENSAGITTATDWVIYLLNKAATWYRTAYTITGTTPQMTLEFTLIGKVYT